MSTATVVPTYLDMASSVARELAARPPGSRAPSEHELAVRYGVNRLTARAALDELERRWVVRRQQGRTTFVAKRIEYRVGLHVPPSWTEAVRQAGGEPVSATDSVRRTRGPSWVRRELGLKADEHVYLLHRAHSVDGELASCSDTWVVASMVPNLSSELPASGSLYRTLADHYGLEPVRAWYRAELEIAPPSVAARLGLSPPPLTLATRGRVDSARLRRPLEVTCGWPRADLLRVVFEMGQQ